MKHVTHHREPRYNVATTCAASLFMPVSAVRRADHLPMLKAWAVHVIGVVLAGVALLGVLASENTYGPYTAFSFIESVLEIFEHLSVEYEDSRAWVMLTFGILLIEVGWWISGLIVMPWSAREEPFRKSYYRALRRLYLLTPHLATIVLVVGGIMVWIEHSDWAYDHAFSTREGAQIVTVILGCLWSLRVVLCAVDCMPSLPCCRWPARCADCGYQLAGLRTDQNCPECGLAVEQSIRPATRPGVEGPGGQSWWFKQTRSAILRPTMLGRRLHALSPDPGYKRCLLHTTVTLMVLSMPAMSGVYIAVETAERYAKPKGIPFQWDEFTFVTFVVGLWIGLLITFTMMVSLLIASGIAGTLEGWRHGRNLMPAAVRAACYLSGFTVLWAVVFWCNLVFFITVMELGLLKPVVMKYNLAMEDLVVAWQGGVILLGIGIYLVQIGKATRAARYANW